MAKYLFCSNHSTQTFHYLTCTITSGVPSVRKYQMVSQLHRSKALPATPVSSVSGFPISALSKQWTLQEGSDHCKRAARVVTRGHVPRPSALCLGHLWAESTQGWAGWYIKLFKWNREEILMMPIGFKQMGLCRQWVRCDAPPEDLLLSIRLLDNPFCHKLIGDQR